VLIPGNAQHTFRSLNEINDLTPSSRAEGVCRSLAQVPTWCVRVRMDRFGPQRYGYRHEPS
jgi:hypothetical protein